MHSALFLLLLIALVLVLVHAVTQRVQLWVPVLLVIIIMMVANFPYRLTP